jgi:hypothetical protein
MKKLSFSFLFLISTSLIAQDEWDFENTSNDQKDIEPAFNDTRIVNGHSVEVLDEKVLDLRISHRFGDIAVPSSGRTLYGLDNSTDIRIGFEYGITDQFMIGVGRSKGAGPYLEVWDGLIKYKAINQSEAFPLSVSLVSSAFATSMMASVDSTELTSFKKLSHRFSYYSQLILAYNLNNLFSIQLSPGLLHRNYVSYEDQNTNFVIGLMAKLKVYKKISLVGEYYHIMRKQAIINNTEYLNPLAISVEIKTHAHVFQLNFMNSKGIGEGQFIPYTSSSWLEGEFRFGFTISRHF